MVHSAAAHYKGGYQQVT